VAHVLCPGATDTEVANVAGAALFRGGSALSVMNAIEAARIGYQGLKARRRAVVTGLVNKIMAISGRLSPTSMSRRISSWMMLTAK